MSNPFPETPGRRESDKTSSPQALLLHAPARLSWDRRLDRPRGVPPGPHPEPHPGDYRTVRQSLYYLGADVTADRLISALERDRAAKRGSAAAHATGFNATM